MAELYQVILLAWDVKRVAEFYRDIVGLKVTYPAPDRELENENWVALDAGSRRLTPPAIAVSRAVRTKQERQSKRSCYRRQQVSTPSTC